MKDTLFSVNDYDKEGDAFETGIYLHFDNTRIRVAENVEEFKQFIEKLIKITEEIQAYYCDNEGELI